MIRKISLTLLFFLFCAGILALALRGIHGNPTEATISENQWKDGPLELSPDRGRFALMFSFVENKSLQFSVPIARFAIPDVAYHNGKYVSLFAPGVSFAIIPGYLVGKYFDIAQVGAFAVIAIFALINMILIRSIAIRFGAHPIGATIAAFTFLFATPAFTYAVSLYQHHISTFLILVSIYALMRWQGILALAIVSFFTALSIPVDNPNIIFMLPLALFAVGRLFFVYHKEKHVVLGFKVLGVFALLVAAIPLFFFAWFNQVSHDDPLKLSGTLPSVRAIDELGNPAVPAQAEKEEVEKYRNPELQHKSVGGFFKTRNLVNGFYVHLISPDRGIIVYTPVILLGLLGLFVAKKKVRNHGMYATLVGVVGANILLYSMWGDPWGGWAFGSRYLIPSYAILSIFLALVLSHFRKNLLFLTLFIVIAAYSIGVNTLGAVTSGSNPPEVEARALEKVTNRQEKFTFERNIELLVNNRSKSFIWQSYARDTLTAMEYYYIVTGSILVVGVSLVVLLYLHRKDGSYDTN